MHITSFRNLKLWDLVFIFDLNKKRRKVEIILKEVAKEVKPKKEKNNKRGEEGIK